MPKDRGVLWFMTGQDIEGTYESPNAKMQIFFLLMSKSRMLYSEIESRFLISVAGRSGRELRTAKAVSIRYYRDCEVDHTL